MSSLPAGLLAVTEQPQNAETPLSALQHPVTPTELFYRRNHFPIPEIDPEEWRLRVEVGPDDVRAVSLAQLQALPQRTVRVTLECAGNARTGMEPRPPGTAWGVGAVSTGDFTGTPLRSLLDPASLPPGAVEVWFRGGDATPDHPRPYDRSLPLEVALHEDTLLVWEMNGEPLPPAYGFPVRLVVAGWYGMAAVKWLTDVRVLSEPFTGFYQRDEYVYLGEEGVPEGEPVARMRVRSLITHPVEGDRLAGGEIAVQGTAWSGSGPIARVEVSADGGVTWQAAELEPPVSPFGAQRWSLAWSPSTAGSYTLLARATDAAGNTQPLRAPWNRLGYGNNACHAVTVLAG